MSSSGLPPADGRLVPAWVSRIASVVYVATVAGLAAHAWGLQQEGFAWSEVAAFVLSLPTVVPALPLIYVFGAAIWNATRADNGGPMWPVTLVYASMFAIIALVNVVSLHWAIRLLRAGRTPPRGTGPAI